MSAPEINKGDFLYRDTLFVNLGPTKCHPRASVSELKALLLPKKGSAPKDQVAHWYEAQLIHYGLPRSKDKNTAKVRLTSAISAGLAVPADIVRTEADMKKQYASAVRKANAGPSIQSEAASKTKKRKADESNGGPGSSTTVSFSFADGTSMNLNHQAVIAAGAQSKKRKTDSAPTKRTPKPKAEASGNKSTIAVAPKPGTSPAAPQQSPPASAPRPKQTARRSKPFQYAASSRTLPSSSHPTYDRTPSSFHDLDSDEEDAPPAYDSLNFKDQDGPPRSNNIRQISGSYSIDVPHYSNSSLALRIDNSTRELWGEFEIGSKKGILRRDDVDGIPDYDAVTFAWRAEDKETGSFDFRRGCEGEIEFHGNGGIRGTFYGLVYREVIEFVGVLEDKHEAPDAGYLRDQWERIPRLAYGRG